MEEIWNTAMLRLPQRPGAELLANWRLQQQIRDDDRRKAPRRVYIVTRMKVAGVERACTILDISASGARVAVQAPKDLPDHVLIRVRGLMRECRVIWRSDCEIGVEFLT